MSVVREKMRQMRGGLKSVTAQFGRTMHRSLDKSVQASQTTIRRPLEWLSRLRGADIVVRASAAIGMTSARASQAPTTAEQPETARQRWQQRHPRLEKALRGAAIALAVFLALPYVFILIYRFVDPPVSALMLRHAVLGYGINKQWVDFENISPNLARAAVIAEDSRFCKHWGVDWFAVGEALEELEQGEAPRGASTIPMQTAKNLFLWPEQTYVRKALEVPLAYFMTLIWPKQRVVEVYLNIAEWGPGIYGAEAAARHHFGRSAASLNGRQSALMVAALPNPHRRNAGRPGPATRRKAGLIQRRVSREAQDASCIFDGN